MTSVSSSSRHPWLQPHLKAERQPNRQIHSFDVKLSAGQNCNADDTTMSFDKVQPKHAKVIGQVDNKFVACIVNGEIDGVAQRSGTLVWSISMPQMRGFMSKIFERTLPRLSAAWIVWQS